MKPLILSAPNFTTSNSFAKVARYHAAYLHRRGYDLYLHERLPRPQIQVAARQQLPWLAQLLGKTLPREALWIFYDNPDGMNHRWDAVHMVPFETATLHPRWVHLAQKVRHVGTHCHTSRYLLLGAGVDGRQVTTVHHGYDPACYYPGASPLFPKRDFTFLYLGHCNGRKGIDTLLHAYCQEFTADEPVTLRLVTQPMYAAVDVRTLISRTLSHYRQPPKIDLKVNVYNAGIGEDDMARLYASGDCLVVPTKGEGFCLPALEAKCCGLEVLASRSSGMLDFLTDANAHLIEVEQIAPDDQCLQINEAYRGLKFWIPSLASLRRLMRRVFEGDRKPEELQSWTWDERLSLSLDGIVHKGLSNQKAA